VVTNISKEWNNSIFRAGKMEVIWFSEMLVPSIRLHGVTNQIGFTDYRCKIGSYNYIKIKLERMKQW
jgi:hypothetical protein